MAITRLGPNQSINLASNVTGTLAAGNYTAKTGNIIQAVTTTDKTRRKYTGLSNNTWYTNYNNLNTSFTPISASSKLMFFVNIHYGTDNSTGTGSIFWRIKEGTTVHTGLNGDTSQSYPCFSQDRWSHSGASMRYSLKHAAINGVQIDSSNTDARTYSFEFRIQNAGDMAVNRDGADESDSSQGNHSPTTVSNLTILEIAP